MPCWGERELPSSQITDVTALGYSDALLAADDTDADFVDWVNSSRRPLQAEMTEQDSVALDMLALRGIDYTYLTQIIARHTGTVPYPTQRLLLSSQARDSKTYVSATSSVLPEFTFTDDEEIDAQYHPLLGIITVNNKFYQEAERSAVADSVADTLGQAAIGRVVNIQVDRQPDPAFRFWYGYQWRWNGESYGAFLQKAATAKLAAIARTEARIWTPGHSAGHALIEPYRRESGWHAYYYESVAAVTLDVLSRAAGCKDEDCTLYRPIWEFAKAGGDEAARDELAEIVSHATGGTILLEELEAAPIAKEGMPLHTLQRVEEACDVESSRRPSRVFIENGAAATD